MFAVPIGQVGDFVGSPHVKVISLRGNVYDTTVPLRATGVHAGILIEAALVLYVAWTSQ